MFFTQLPTEYSHLIFISKKNPKSMSNYPTLDSTSIKLFSTIKLTNQQKYTYYITYTTIGLLPNIKNVKSKLKRNKLTTKLFYETIISKKNTAEVVKTKDVIYESNTIENIKYSGYPKFTIKLNNLYGNDPWNLRCLRSVLLQKNICLHITYTLKKKQTESTVKSYLNLTGLIFE